MVYYLDIFQIRYAPAGHEELYETANWSLRQGDQEVNKRIKQKYIYWNKLTAQIFLQV